MGIDLQIIVAVIFSCALAIPACLILCKRAKINRISIKYIPLKVFIIIGVPILSLPFLLSNKITWLTKLEIVSGGLVAGIIYFICITASTNSFRKQLGLHPVNEDTGEIMSDKEDKSGPQSGKWF